MRKILMILAASAFLSAPWLGHFSVAAQAQDREIVGVSFPAEIVLEGKTLKLNGVAARKAFGFIKVYAGGFYLETPTQDAERIIRSEQVKHFDIRYLTNKATAEKIQNSFIEMMEKTNPPELVEKHREDIRRHAMWMDKDMAPGKTSKNTYVPGVGLKVEYQGELKGVIPDPEYAQMYYRFVFGEKAEESLKKGYLGQ